MAERREPVPDPLCGPLLDLVFELVDLLVERVDQVEEALGDVVDEVVEDDAGLLLVYAGGLAPTTDRRVARPPSGVFRTVTITSRVRTTSTSW